MENLMKDIRNMFITHGWTIAYDEFHIDFNIPFHQQINELNEDLIQVRKDDYLIDIGWYPEMNPNGKIRTVLIKNNNWNQPEKIFEDSNYDDFINHIYIFL